MATKRCLHDTIAVAGLALAAGLAAAQPVSLTPDFDVYHYPPIGNGLTEFTAAVFGSPLDEPEEDRLSFYVVAFDTSGIDLSAFADPEVTGATLTVFVANSSTMSSTDTVEYDPTYDPISTYAPLGTEPDADPGRPLSLFGVALREGLDLAGWRDAGAPLTTGGQYSAFPVQAGPGGAPESVLDNVDDAFDAVPFAVAQTTDTQFFGGTERIQNGAELTFTIDAADPDINAYLIDGVQSGLLGLAISGLHGARSPVTGEGAGEIYVRIACMELSDFTQFPLGTLELEFGEGTGSGCSFADQTSTGATIVGQPGFGQPDNVIDADDLGYYLNLWVLSDLEADGTTSGATLEGQPGFGVPDGVVDLDDLGFFLSVWLIGCP